MIEASDGKATGFWITWTREIRGLAGQESLIPEVERALRSRGHGPAHDIGETRRPVQPGYFWNALVSRPRR